MSDTAEQPKGVRAGSLLGSLKEALAAAARDDTALAARKPAEAEPAAAAPEPPPATPAEPPPLPGKSAAEAARDARGGTRLTPGADRHVESEPAAATTRLVRGMKAPEPAPKTELIRGRQPLKRGRFETDPVVGWLVVVGGPGLGKFRPIFEGNNTIGRATSNRIALDFGDESISSEEQAYIRYDSSDRTFLLIPNLSKTNTVGLNAKRPTAAVPLSAMDVITMGRTQLVFTPFCGPDFDWSEITETRE